MGPFRWTKLQDFWLRLGLLKVLVGVLPSARRSSMRDAILRQIESALFASAAPWPDLRARAEEEYRAEFIEPVSIARVLLLGSGSPSWGQPVSKGGRVDVDKKRRSIVRPSQSTVSKILEWGQTAGLVGAGNKITERGLMLRSFLEPTFGELFRGNPRAWNPFVISDLERAFFFYHLGEYDNVLWHLAYDLGRLGKGVSVYPADVRSMTIDALRKLLDHSTQPVPLSDLPKYRTLRSLVAEMLTERDREPVSGGSQPRRTSLRTGPRRQRTKHADHEAIPRFEQLVDLGFLTKAVEDEVTGKDLQKQRNSWTFVVTEQAERFAQEFGAGHPVLDSNWHRTRFARLTSTCGLMRRAEREIATEREALRVFLQTYEEHRRPVGHTPFETIAILSMIRGLEKGIVFEVEDLRRLMLRLKASGGLGGKVFFAAGLSVERMFLLIKPGALEAYDLENASRTLSSVERR